MRWGVRVINPFAPVVFRRLVLVALAVLAMWQPMTHGSPLVELVAVAECLVVCAAILVMIPERLPAVWRTGIGIGTVVLLSVLSLFLVGYGSAGASMLFFIVGIAGARLNSPYAWWTGGVAAVGFVTLLILTKPFSGVGIAYIGYTMGFIATFIAGNNGRLRRQSQAAQEQHLLDLERAHEALQTAHRDLQEASIRSMQLAVVQERNRIARDIHDSVGHALTSLIVQLQALQYRVRSGADGAEQQIQDLVKVARNSLEEVRQSVRAVADASPITGVQAMSALVDGVRANTKLSVTFQTDVDAQVLSMETSLILYRALQESLTNVVRHSAAEHVRVNLDWVSRIGQTCIRLQVADDGQFQSGRMLEEGFGLSSMRSRCEDVGGTLNWTGVEPHGMQVEVVLPWNKPSGEETQHGS
ncbi:sensor histidine kinase [Alicyclobacillus sp. ALC3]|uniref:sensor histidine kinase n=1 Tax=Alicyclobacillus sp. ALC3 TaxID=2796143 RepID=UPI00237859B7|nr:sensor histidine kinase [Alicyclobacillus sp. ALC3]WDL97612.1 sensor histidine kinase [Alicyclobacillus sp. ALC3]